MTQHTDISKAILESEMLLSFHGTCLKACADFDETYGIRAALCDFYK
jgi:hypothetical protein